MVNFSRFIFKCNLIFCFLSLFTFAQLKSSEMGENKTVLIAILARNKEHVLPHFLNCIKNLDYDKKLVSLYINTNNNEDQTKEILENWVKKNESQYNRIFFENHHIPQAESTRPHEWTASRFKVLGDIRNKSLQKAKEEKVDYYFVVDCDNFIVPFTLKELMSKNKPIIAPLLKAVPEVGDLYSNYFCDIDAAGYYKNHPDYLKIWQQTMIGTFKVPVVHCTYLIQSAYLDQLTYTDDTSHHEFVIFSRVARDKGIDQYICNEKQFGVLLHFHHDLTLEEEKKNMEILNFAQVNADADMETVFTHTYDKCLWGSDPEGKGTSGEGSKPEIIAEYMKFLEEFIKYNEIQSVLDVGCGDWSFSQHMHWGKVHYTRLDVVKSMIERNQSKFSSPTIHFIQGDITSMDLPSADLMICKDVLQHLPNESILSILNQISKFKHCLITNDIDEWSLNKPIKVGDYHAIDLTKPPFNIKGTKIFNFRSGYVVKQVLYINHMD